MNEFFSKSSFDQAMESIKRFGFDEAKEQIMSYRGTCKLGSTSKLPGTTNLVLYKAYSARIIK